MTQFLVLVLFGLCYAGQPEDVQHSHLTEHYTDDDEHNADFDHEAVLGSRESEEEFSHLSPEESKTRLRELVDKMDDDDDGSVSKDELTHWIFNSFRTLDEEEAAQKLAEHDLNGDAKLSWYEVVEGTYDYTFDEIDQMKLPDSGFSEDQIKTVHEQMVLDQEKFNVADVNHDHGLDALEYAGFLHPYDYEHMAESEVKRVLKEFDANGDKKISMQEFVKDFEDEESRISEEENFHSYDEDKSGYLETREIAAWVTPDNEEAAEAEMSHLMAETDNNKDGRLSPDEIVEKYQLWVGSEATDYGNHLLRDEL